MLYAAVQAWKADLYQTRVPLADGGVFQRGLHTGFRPYLEILDFTHAKSHIHDCAGKLFGEGTPVAEG